MDCLFCKIIAQEIPAEILYEDDQVIAFSDINPAAPFHALVIPRKHIASVNEIAEEDCALVGHMQRIAAHLAKEQGLAEEGYRTVFNCGPKAGQTVYHIHLHVLGGKQLGWPPYADEQEKTLRAEIEL